MARPGVAISRRRSSVYDIYEKDDGLDYWRIVHAYLQAGVTQHDLAARLPEKAAFTLGVGEGEMRFTTISCTNPKRLVFLVETSEGKFLLKWMRRGSLGLKRLFPNSIGLTQYSRLFRKVREAIDNGCAATQDYRLVAERWVGWTRMEVLAVLEYVEGAHMGDQDDYSPYVARLRTAVEEILRHGLTLDDLSPYNFIVAEDGIKVIDLSCRPPTRVNAVKMVTKMNARYGLALPIRGVVDNCLRALLAVWYGLRRPTRKS